MQKFQDWFTQQWVILWGRKIEPDEYSWLIAPFGSPNGIGEVFIYQLAEKEGLSISRNVKSHGLIESINVLELHETEFSRLSHKVIDFYENTSDYTLDLSVKWNPFFKFFGLLVSKLFSRRIMQLNLPEEDNTLLKSEIITLSDRNSGEVKYTIWFRTSIPENQVLYSGIYGTCRLPSGKKCIKAVFPLPQGNATVIMTPSVGKNGELILDSSGKRIGDAGFYFLLNDSKGYFWTQFIASFRDKLIVKEEEGNVYAVQVLTLWRLQVLKMTYVIKGKEEGWL